MTPEQQSLSDQIRASTDAFLRAGGSITRLNYAGVPVDDEYGRPVHVPAWAEPQFETAKEWCERVITKPFTAEPPPPPRHLDVHLPKPTPPVVTPKEKAALAEFLADMRPLKTACLITRLRALRADAQRTLAQLNRLVESV
jgi:hypothetical protein